MEDYVRWVSLPPIRATSRELQQMRRNKNALREELNECLTNINPKASFAFFEGFANAPNPGISLKNGGIIGLPLSDRDAQTVVRASHKAPFGKGEQTLVDTGARKTWEIPEADFAITNPAWKSFLESVVAKVNSGLGVDAAGKGVTAELYKLLLYDKGAMLKPHQDSEKLPQIFGTLVIALPSKHKGGESHLTHAGKTEIFKTSAFSEFGFSCLAWFSDVVHEVKPVSSGHRLVLTYNLVHGSLGPRELAATSDIGIEKLRSILSGWKDKIHSDPLLQAPLAFILQYQYTVLDISSDKLKGHDQQVVSHLRQACENSEFCLYLASCSKTVSGQTEIDYFDKDDYYEKSHDGSAKFHEIEEEEERVISLGKVVGLHGNQVAQEMEFGEDSVIQNEPFKNVTPTHESFTGYTGNESARAMHFYHKTLVMIVPKSFRLDFLLGENSSREARHQQLLSGHIPAGQSEVMKMRNLRLDFSRNPGDAKIRRQLEEICQAVIRKTLAWKALPRAQKSPEEMNAPFHGVVLASVVRTSVTLGDLAMFLNAYPLCSGQVPRSMFFAVGKALVRYNLHSVLPRLAAQIATVESFSERHSILMAIRSGLKAEANTRELDDNFYRRWGRIQIHEALTTMELTDKADGNALACVAACRSGAYSFTCIVPAVRRNVKNTTMVISFLSTIFKFGHRYTVDPGNAKAIFKRLINDMSDHFDFNERLTEVPPSMYEDCSIEDWADNASEVGESTASILYQCQTLGHISELNQLVKKLRNGAASLDVDLFNGHFLPLLKSLLHRLKDGNTIVKDTPLQQLFQHLLTSYIVRYVGAEPKPYEDWTRPTVACICKDCRSLNSFLSSPVEESRRFARKPERRSHPASQIRWNGDVSYEKDKRAIIFTKASRTRERNHEIWKERCDEAKEHLTALDSDVLKDLLLEYHEPIMSLSAEELGAKLQLVQLPQDMEDWSIREIDEALEKRINSPFDQRMRPRKGRGSGPDQLVKSLEEDLIDFLD